MWLNNKRGRERRGERNGVTGRDTEIEMGNGELG